MQRRQGAKLSPDCLALVRTQSFSRTIVFKSKLSMETPLTPLDFARRARKLYADRVAVVDGQSRWTYAQFLGRCDRWSSMLQRLGVRRQDRVAYLAPNTHAQ